VIDIELANVPPKYDDPPDPLNVVVDAELPPALTLNVVALVVPEVIICVNLT
jgi:hypothetical protein